MTKNEMIKWLKEEDQNALKELYRRAYEVKLKHVGANVYFRGIIEFSNICRKDCLYCGIRRSNAKYERFQMSKEEIFGSAKQAFEMQYGSIVLQSGERNDPQFVEFVTDVVKGIKELSGNKLGITLSLGEQSKETYQRWFDAGAHRYLLRIETSNPALYRSLHPVDHDFNERLNCLTILKGIGYQTGTGVMIGLPGQTLEDLADDILFFKDMNIDMIGMGPYIVHNDTPLGKCVDRDIIAKNFDLGLKMIALTRIYLEDVNIAATTALQALNPEGREMGLQCGANIIMPNITHTKYRKFYQLYENKPCLDENAGLCRDCLSGRIATIGGSIGFNEWGDPPHFLKKNKFLN
ncbi:MAG: [FeFe] hydrogenase H-cluster radical SAM maturase HydE [Omnitrophica WOR_2 bacterium RIFOXYA12_FULL_38_10]|nr:MAG: [FeFe] hydrogenase H-cluster radical SAM maturase HydE [Omnitrophica WOR_2 bacterium RIFOXYA12_FULL_38_10]